MTDDLAFATPTDLSHRIREKSLSSRELTQHVLDRIEQLDGELNSFTMVHADDALKQAEAKDAETVSGADLPPLHGIPAAIKELALLAGHPATFGSRAFASNVVDVDANHVAKLKAAGVVVVGKTNAPEFGSTPYTDPELYGPTRNPWNLAHTPGGSSGGAGAALAAGLVPVADASDGGGSTRIPASACGLLGLKPSRFRISNGPLTSSIAMDLGSAGPIGRTVQDVALLLDVMSGYVPGDPGMAPPPPAPFTELARRQPPRLRVGVLRTLPHVSFSDPVRAAVARAADLLADAGHEVIDVDVEVPDHVIEAFRRMWAALQALYPVSPDHMEPHNAYYAAWGNELHAGDVYAAEFQLGAYVRQLVARFHTEFDVLAAPVMTDLPPEVGATRAREPAAMWDHATDLVGITPIFNATGQPALSLPVHVDDATGLPVGVQVAGRYADEATLLQLAAQLEPVTRWDRLRPPYPVG